MNSPLLVDLFAVWSFLKLFFITVKELKQVVFI